MPFRSGDIAKISGDIICDKCYSKVYINTGHKIPKCPNCGNTAFERSPDQDSGKSQITGKV